MSYTPTAPSLAALHSLCDPNGGTLCTDGSGATPAVNSGDAILSNKDSLTSALATKIGARTGTLSIASSGVKSLNVTNASIASNSAGMALQWASGTLDPANCTIFLCLRPDRRGKTIDDMLCDPGNSPGTTAFINQICHDSGNIKSFNGSASFGANGGSFIAPSHRGYMLAIATVGGVCTLYRHDHYDANGNLLAVAGGRAISSTPAATGWTVLGRSAADSFFSGDLYLAFAVATGLNSAQVRTEFAAMKPYVVSKGLAFDPAPGAPLLIINGDSLSMGTGASRCTTEVGYLLQQGLIGRGIYNLDYFSLGAGSRQVTQADDLEQVIVDLANGTSGEVVYPFIAGTNDLNGVTTDQGLLSRYRAHFGNLKRLAPKIRIVLCGITARTDISGATLNNFNAARFSVQGYFLGGDPTFGTLIDGYVDLAGDAGLGSIGASNLTTFFSGDKVHWNDAGNSRVYNQADGARRNLLNTVYPLYFAQGLPMEPASRVVGGPTLINTSAIRTSRR